MIVIQWDATNPAGIDPHAAAAAFYMDGLYANGAGVHSRAPGAFLTPITVTGHPLARICDTEPGNVGVDGALRWLADQRRTDPLKLGDPDAYGLYADGSDWDKAGQTEGVRWLAKPDGDPRIPAGFHAKQYVWATAYDLSSCASGYFPKPKPAPATLHHYERYPLGPFRVTRSLVLNERATVQAYDALYLQQHRGPRVDVLRSHVKLLRDRVWAVAHTHQGHPDWTSYWRGWRWQKLNERLSGPVVLNA